MSSSTSSSEAVTVAGSRRTFLRIWLVVVLGMAVAMGVIRLVTFALDARSETILERVMEAREALPRIVAEEDPLVLVYGSSMVGAGFAARRFDHQLAEQGIHVKSFNFGFGGLNPFFQDYQARRVRDAFEAEDRRLELAVIEFNPFQTTKARYDGARAAIDSFVTMLATPEELWEIARRDPERGARLFNIRYARNEISAEMITWFFGQPLRRAGGPPEIERDEELMKRYREVGDALSERFEEEYPDYPGDDWYYPWQGGGTIREERSAETLELFEEYYAMRRHEDFLEPDKLQRVQCCDIEELDFEEELIQAFIRTVATFREFSDHVEIILLPRNTDWIRYTPEVEAKLAALLDRIRAETGVVVKNFQDIPQVTPEMFSDTTHLARYSGDEAFTDFLAEEYAEVLGPPRR